MSDTLLEVRGLCKRYDGFLALNGVNFSLRSDQIKGIMGPNGAGKSTFLKLLAGELKVSSGSVNFVDQPVTNLPVDRTNNLGISYMPQQPGSFPTLTVEENVRGAAQTGLILERTEDQSVVRALLDLVELSEKAGVTAAELPFGDKRLLDLALALATGPRLLLADEPTAGVDRDSSEKILRLLRRLSSSDTKDEFGLDGLIFTEHDREVLFEFPDEIGFLRAGELIVEGAPEKVKHQKVVRDYLTDHTLFDDGEKDLV